MLKEIDDMRYIIEWLARAGTAAALTFAPVPIAATTLPAIASEAPSAVLAAPAPAARLAPVEAWIVEAMVAVAPPDRCATIPSWEESPEHRLGRYRSFAHDVAQLIDGARVRVLDRQGNAMLLLALAYHETGFAADTDLGACYREGTYGRRCDGGLAVGPWQAHLAVEDRRAHQGDRPWLAERALRDLVASFKACRDLPWEDRFSAYGGGACQGSLGSRSVWAIYQRMLHVRPAPRWPAREAKP